MANNEEQEEQPTVFIMWVEDSDSWNGARALKSVHSSLVSALNDIPERYLTTEWERPLYGKQVANYTYYTVTEEPLFTKTG